jgi:hypothetical protein
MKRNRLLKAVLISALAALIGPATPATADPGAGHAQFEGNVTANPGIDTSSNTTHHYNVSGTLAGVFNGLPFAADCTFSGDSIGNETLVMGTAGLSGNCANGPVRVVVHVDIDCHESFAGSASITLTRVGAAAVVDGRCRITIWTEPPTVTISCIIEIHGAAELEATTQPAASFTATAQLLLDCR